MNLVQCTDGARDLAFQCAQMVDALREAGRAESGVAIEDLVADATAGGEAFFGHGHAQARDVAFGYEDPGTVSADLVGHIEALELRDDLSTEERRGGNGCVSTFKSRGSA